MQLRSAILFLVLLSASTFTPAQTSLQQFADLGRCRLENGQTILDCRIGYRTLGTLNPERSNAVVLTTWFLGNSEQAARSMVGADSFVDPSRYYVIVVDALGDGVSSSPSNSVVQPRMRFPVFTIRDMVETQHRLLVETLHLQHVHAVVGGSMGGMQALQWAFSYPDFMDRVVATVGSPRLTSFDLLLWRSELNAIQSDVEWRGGEYTGTPMIQAAIDIHTLHLRTAAWMARETSPHDYPKFAEDEERRFHFDPNNQIRQLQALMSQDVAPGKSTAEMAKMLKPSTMFVVAKQDMMANPIPATELARAAAMPLIELASDCGHLAPGCESEKVYPAVRAFLAK